ncbi:MAG: class B sortase [Ruminococcus sp.]|nr:class B sortase [Ruminococcus sp.]
MNRTRSEKKIWIITLIVLLLLIVLCVGYMIFRSASIKNDEEEYKNLASSVAPNISSTEITSPSHIDVELADNPIDFDSLVEKNKDIYAWIYIPDTKVNYPVCQSSTDDNFYLDHDIYGNYSFPGAIYSQMCNSKTFNDRVTVLYGHNMADNTMFGDIHKFGSEKFMNEHRYFYIYTPGHKLKYEAVSAYVYDDRHIMNSFDFSKNEVFQEYINSVLNPRSLTKCVREGASIDINDNIVTLSTCLDVGQGRFLLQGVLVEDELTK